MQTINTREHTPDRARVLSQNMAHFGNLCRVFERLNRMPSLEPILEKIQARLEIAQLKAERLRNNPGKAPKAPLRPEDGKERLEQLYDLVSLYAAAYWNSSQLECLDSLCDDAAGMGFRTEDIQFLIEEIKQVIRDKAGNSQSSASS